MDIKKLSNLDKRTRVIIMFIYAVVMFIVIQTKISIITFFILFAVVPTIIYFYIKTIFPKDAI